MKTDVAKFHGWTEDQLKELPTRQLMAIRAASFHYTGCTCCRPPVVMYEDERLYNRAQNDLNEKVTAILRTREHIPNKREGQRLRRVAAKRKR